MNQLKVEHLTFQYRKAKSPTLTDVSFSADAGQVTSLIGPNGAGKTTAIKAAVGILKASGSIRINGSLQTEKPSKILLSEISYLTQEGSILSSLTVFEVILLGRVGSLGLKVPQEDLQKVWETLKALHLESLADRPYFALSGGQRKIVNLAQAIAKGPKVLVLDEPTANLDMQKELEVMHLIREYTLAKKTATLVTLHDLNLACRFSDKLVLLKDGTVFSEGAPRDVITAESIKDAYGVNAEVVIGKTGIPHIHPRDSVRETHFCFDQL